MLKDERTIADEQWQRYVYGRDNGHLSFVSKATRCEDFVAGDQWNLADKAALNAVRRPALTINKTLITLASVTGEQIDTRSEISFRPSTGAPPGSSELHTKVFRFISDKNQLNWVRTAVFADGAVTSRGYYDARMDFERNKAGDIAITQLNPRNVIPDPDAGSYDPKKWGDVIVTSWYTGDDIQLLYGKERADVLRARTQSSWEHGFDSIDMGTSTFGGSVAKRAGITTAKTMLRNIRVLERQHRVLDRREMFVDVRTGLMREVPEEWSRDEIAQFMSENPNLVTTKELTKRVRWTVTAEDMVLHDEWSPYRNFTVVPFFPVFRWGRTIGLIEGLLDPQELLNKTISQELHVVNTMANSGWMVRKGAIMNMTMEELEEVGARTGLVLEISADDVAKAVQKIQPNQIPSGLDRISFKAENFIKSISGRGDSVMGLDRADVSGKAIGEKKQSADVPLRPAMDNLERSDFLLAGVVLDMVQTYYTDPRILNITHDDLTGEMTEVPINQPQPGSGEVMNDLSLGEFDIVVVSQTAKRTLEESQFEQALAMREAGIAIPDRFLIQNSNLLDKGEIIKKMDADAQSESAIIAQKAQDLARQLEVANLKADASETESRAVLAKAKAAQTIQETQAASGGQDSEMLRAQQEHEMKMTQMREEHALKMQIAQDEAALKIKVANMQAQEKMRQQRLQTIMAAKQTAATPGSVGEAAQLARAGGGAKQPAHAAAN